ncbi:MAG: pyruvate synthase, partial [Firmicutes bacterium]|nr:pyruvate synthase [Bacillota bacterium]
SPSDIKRALKIQSQQVYTVNASRIAAETIGRPIPNTPLLGALVRVTNIMSLEQLLADTKKKLARKFADRPQIVQGNLEAVRLAYKEVEGE